MKKNNYIRALKLLLIIMMTVSHVTSASEQLAMQAIAKEHAAVSFAIVVCPSKETDLHAVATVLQKAFSFSGQFDVVVKSVTHEPSKQSVKQLFGEKHQLALFINEGQNSTIEWRLYDTLQGKMVDGKYYTKRGAHVAGWAYNIADTVWPVLTGHDGFFSTKIAYCKEVKMAKGKHAKQVCVADYDGSNPVVLVDSPTVNVAPRWGHDTNTPLLFYSEYTNTNVRLVSVDMQRHRRITSNFDGINMLPAFSRDGSKVVYCASRGDGNCQLYFCGKEGFRKLTNNTGNNISPTFSDDANTIVFCSDYETGKPQIYSYNLIANQIMRITDGVGYCASPAYCSKRQQIAYAKMVKGTMQLFLYDEKSKTETQLTHDAAHKEECSWSPCGNYLVFSVEKGATSQIALLNVLTNKQQFLTSAQAHCSYPAWSPIYTHYPVLHTS